jgi:hypothetical protein
MGTFIVAFIGNGFVASAQDAPLLGKLSPKARRRLLVLLYFTVRSTYSSVSAMSRCFLRFGNCACTIAAPRPLCRSRKPLSHGSLATSIARLAARQC